MKAISIRQPWASLTAAGIRDIDLSNRDTNYRGPVLIVASSRRVGRDFGHDVPIDWYCRVRNAQALGFIPYDAEMPLSSVIGVAQLQDCTPSVQDSPWSAAGINWVLHDAHTLTSPISGIKGKQGLFDIPEIKEETLLSQLRQTTKPWSTYEDGTFTVSMTDEEMERQISRWPLVLTLCGDGLVDPILTVEDGRYKLKPIRQVRLTSNNKVEEIGLISADIYTEENPSPFKYIAFELE